MQCMNACTIHCVDASRQKILEILLTQQLDCQESGSKTPVIKFNAKMFKIDEKEKLKIEIQMEIKIG